LQKILTILLVLFIFSDANAKQYKLLIIGDSITSCKFSYGYLFQEKFPTKIIAKSGANVRWMYDKIKNIEMQRYTHLLILGGVNDIDNYRLKNAQKYLLKIYSKAKASGLIVIGITLSPWKSWQSWNIRKHRLTVALNQWIKNQPIDYVADFYTLVKSQRDVKKMASKYNRWSDGLHPNQLAHKALFKYILQIF